MLRILALLLLPIALFVAACGGSGSPSEPSAADFDPPAAESDPSVAESDPPASALDVDSEGGGLEALDDLFAGLDPFSLMGGLDLASSFPDVSQAVDPALTNALLDEGDLPAEFTLFGDFSFSIPGEVASTDLASRIFATGELESDDPGTMVMSMAMALPPEALEELGSIDDLNAEIERSFDEFGIGEALGFDGIELLDASGLGDGGFGMRLELDLSAMFGAITAGFSLDGADIQIEQTGEMPYAAGIGMEMYFFFRGARVLATMVMWPLDAPPDVDVRALAETMDAKAAALE